MESSNDPSYSFFDNFFHNMGNPPVHTLFRVRVLSLISESQSLSTTFCIVFSHSGISGMWFW